MLKIPILHKSVFWTLLILSALTFPLYAQAQLADFGLVEKMPAERLTASGYLSVDKVQPGSQFQIAVVVEIAEGWHVNANPAGEGLIGTEIIFPDTPHLTFREVVYPTGELLKLGSIGEAPVYHGTLTIGIQADLSQDAPIEQIALDVQLRYQACNDEQCLLPETLTFAVPIEIVGMEGTVQRMNEAVFASIEFGVPPSSGSGDGGLARALSGGRVWLAFLLVFVGGILTSLTPCVYPLIPITVSIFGANESAGLFKSFLLSVIYVVGIVVTYSTLGVAVASTGAVFGQIMANPWIVGFITLILVLLGLSMFGVFEIRLPYAVQNRLNTVGGAGFAGAFAMGTVGGLIAAPCTGPALAVVLTYIATTGSLLLGFWLMFTYALGMGLLFIGIGTFSGLLSALPRSSSTYDNVPFIRIFSRLFSRLPQSGVWMYVLENIFGIAIITIALYFLKDVFPPLQNFLQNSLPFFAIAGGLVLIGLWIGKLTQRFRDIPRRVQFQKACGLLLAILGAYMFIGGIQQPAGPHLNWVYDETEGFEIAKREDKLVMLDFYASWCAACKELDHKTYADPAIAAKLADYVNVKLDFTRSSETTEVLTEKYQIPGLPVVIFMDAEGRVLKRLTGFVGPEEMLSILNDIENNML